MEYIYPIKEVPSGKVAEVLGINLDGLTRKGIESISGYCSGITAATIRAITIQYNSKK